MGHKAGLIAVLVFAPALAWADAPARATSALPSGEGDPNAITCRPPQVLPGSRLLGPEVCKTNAVWAQYRKDGMEVSADGRHDVHSEKWRSTTPQACHSHHGRQRHQRHDPGQYQHDLRIGLRGG